MLSFVGIQCCCNPGVFLKQAPGLQTNIYRLSQQGQQVKGLMSLLANRLYRQVLRTYTLYSLKNLFAAPVPEIQSKVYAIIC